MGARERAGRVRAQWARLARSEPVGTVLVYTALVVSSVATATLLLTVQWITPTERATLVVVGLIAWVLVVTLGWTRGTLPLRPVVAAIAVTVLLAVATPSHQSQDVFSYAMYGRIVTEHHHNPYNSYPMHFEGDPMRRHVSALWQRTPDIYGPAFTVVMAAFAPVIGESTFLARFVYQLIAAAAVGAVLWLLWKRMRSPTMLAFVGLHPLVAVSVVNGGHPDALIALAFLLAFLLALERRVVWCALALAVGVAINFSVIAGAGALGVWAARRWTRPEVVKLAAITLGLGAAPYLFLSGWLDNAKEHQQLISRLSIWNPLASLLTDSGPFPFVSLTTRQLRSVMPNSTTLMAGLLLLFVLVRFTDRRTPELAIAAALAAFLVTSPWVMPWYAFAAFPFLAMRKPNLLTWAVAIYSAFILVSDQFPSLSPQVVGSLAHHFYQTVVPVLACLACVVAIVFRPRARDVSAPAPDDELTLAPA
jgi:hypothetical protein